MKKHLSKGLLWQSLLSLGTLGAFILLAVGSVDFGPDIHREYQGDGVYREVAKYDDFNGGMEITTGKCDEYGRWNGPVEIVTITNRSEYIEEVTMINGKRHGQSKLTLSGGAVRFTCYDMDVAIECKKAAGKGSEYSSAFGILSEKHPWFLYRLNAFGFDDTYVESYLDSLENVLKTFTFEIEDLDMYYQESLDVLRETTYDSIISLNSIFSMARGLEELKNSEFRLACVDSYHPEISNTFRILKSTYPNYVYSLNNEGVNDQDIEMFCQDMDSILNSYGPLDREDPLFPDSLDTRLYRAMLVLMDTKKSSFPSTLSRNIAVNYTEPKDFRITGRKTGPLVENPELALSSSEVATVVLSLMLQQYNEQDILKRCLKEAYFILQDIAVFPTVTTELSGNHSATSAGLQGNVHYDGGAEVISRGIAWADFYNPTVNNQVENSGAGIGEFTVTLTGLTEGITYYARTFATNRAGTAYGNCVSFVAGSNVGIEDAEPFAQEFTIYPNPAPGYATFSFNLDSPESMTLILFNMKG
ncbi:MAG: hypothetical protein IH594_16450, partial [Bacteroidales bacterium]|nr:hypothetical protein [Bacteroidales bacterium]